MERISITQWIKNFRKGQYDSKDLDTQIEAGWYDWFCSERSLAKKTQNLAVKLIEIKDSTRWDNNQCYVWFKNNCPVQGELYDTIGISSINSRKLLYSIVPCSGFTKDKKQAQVWGLANNFAEPLIAGTWKDVIRWFYQED